MSQQKEIPINTLFQRKNYTDEDTEISVRNCDVERREKVKNITKQLLRAKIENMRAEYESSIDRKNLQFSGLVKAVVKANVHENRATEKFLNNVETIMERFNNLDSLEKIYADVMKRLPKAE